MIITLIALTVQLT